MKIDILTLFPEMFETFQTSSIIGRAVEKEALTIQTHNIRDFAHNKHKQADDYPYGGGAGMVMMVQPLSDSIQYVLESYQESQPKIIYLTPQGRVFTQELAQELSELDSMLLLCGHYEGIDQRIIDKYVDMEISIGDYVLTGGEIPAMVLIDSVTRLIPGVLGSPDSTIEESHSNGVLLEYPQYTRPAVYNDDAVPDVLLSGNHKEIDKWRRQQSLKKTLKNRPDLLKKGISDSILTDEDIRYLNELEELGELEDQKASISDFIAKRKHDML